jgi:hypothetical protein
MVSQKYSQWIYHYFVASDKTLKATHKGVVYIVTGHDGRTQKLMDVLYVLGLRCNLMSLSQIDLLGYKVSGRNGKISVHNKQGGQVLWAHMRQDGLYVVDAQMKTMQALSTETQNEARLWHRRLGHTGYSTLQKMAKNEVVEGFPEAKVFEEEICWDCSAAKQVRKPFPSSDHVTSRRLELVHSDVLGPMDVSSAGGCKYVCTLIDDFEVQGCGYLEDSVTSI